MAQEIANLNAAVVAQADQITILEAKVAALSANTINPADVVSATDSVAANTARIAAVNATLPSS